ncbi:MAG: DUF5009 domain-containing protein [Bryobacteraceae bacterium]|nr:DUF5009 domain-containing protein [Bryobacteraceae bacterium]
MATAAQSPDRIPVTGRNVAIDVLRGFVMTLMLAEVLHLPGLPKAFPGNPVASFLAFHQSHVEWAGCSLHDLIQPTFSLLVGAAMAYSLAARRARGDAFPTMLLHAVWRAFALGALGIVLRSFNRPVTNFTFEDTLTQIGLGYVPLFLLAFASTRVQILALATILVGYWGAFALYPATQSPDWPVHYTGFAAHWNKNTNLAWAFDTWFLNLFPREKPFVANGGGYATLSFIPTLGTMLIGLLAGEYLRRPGTTQDKLAGLLKAGAVLLALGVAWHFTGTGPFVKRIWTPSFALGSGGLVLLMLAAAWYLTEVLQWRRWAFPLIVVGANSIVAYLLAHVFERGIIDGLNRHLTRAPFQILGEGLETPVRGLAVLAIFWLSLWWMYRRKVFVKI